ncbi:endoplasmic reticulum metallopeptidase 1-like [Anopheles bellator]|uniref:endoplasmic reticulum metallopeptidase 1-like n=1 Tax=Anopheles bellator TaxID=139047 RepID=UPI0026497DBF|nr:endoplasmic reticulum metallopeptidase 1-like [Anopheles bellator]
MAKPAEKRVRFKENTQRVKDLHQLGPGAAYVGVLLVFASALLTRYWSTRLPAALTVSDLEQTPHAFIAERAWASLKTLNDIGPKPVGSQANELLAHEFLLKELQTIGATSHPAQALEVDRQTVTGAFATALQNQSMTSMYRNVQNVVARLVGDGPQALLLNCHFDTVASSPGASDDGASCAVMLEVLRVLSRRPVRARHTITFLFNGAEETMLQAAHGFITQHPWAVDVRAFLNLESSGSGGKEVLFQAGPHHPWLIEAYARAIRYPYAHAVGEEIFQLGLIPSDTDFRMFRDYGEVPGMDFAHIANGYRYHTRYDSMDFLSLEVLQRTGDNILQLTRELANGEELAAGLGRLSKGETVFFDLVGLLFVHYSVAAGRLINLSVSILAVVVPLLALGRRGHRTPDALRETVFGLVATFLGTVFSLVSCTTIARQMDFFGYSMSWYTNTYLIVGMYCCPALMAHCFVYLFLVTFYSSDKSKLTRGEMTQARIAGVTMFWAIVTVGATLAGYRSAYITMVLLLCSLASSTVNAVFGNGRTARSWIYVHLAFQLPALLWTTNFYNVLIELFVPITGRFGGSRNPDVFISLLAAAGTLLCCSYLLPLIAQLRSMMSFTAKLSAITVVTLLVACFSPLGFPYRDESTAPSAPTPQRHYVTHTFRVFHDEIGLYKRADSGYLFQEMDRNTKRTIEQLVGPGETLIPVRKMSSCDAELFCALPFHSLWHQMRFNNYWLPGPEPVYDNMVTMAYLGTEELGSNRLRLSFAMDASIQSSVMVGPKEGVKLIGWSLLDQVPPPARFAGREAHFVSITHGLPGKTWNVTLDLQYDQPKRKGELVDIVVTTKFWEYHHMHTRDFEQLLAEFPPWAHVVPSVAVTSVFPL